MNLAQPSGRGTRARAPRTEEGSTGPAGPEGHAQCRLPPLPGAVPSSVSFLMFAPPGICSCLRDGVAVTSERPVGKVGALYPCPAVLGSLAGWSEASAWQGQGLT